MGGAIRVYHQFIYNNNFIGNMKRVKYFIYLQRHFLSLYIYIMRRGLCLCEGVQFTITRFVSNAALCVSDDYSSVTHIFQNIRYAAIRYRLCVLSVMCCGDGPGRQWLCVKFFFSICNSIASSSHYVLSTRLCSKAFNRYTRARQRVIRTYII